MTNEQLITFIEQQIETINDQLELGHWLEATHAAQLEGERSAFQYMLEVINEAVEGGSK